MKSNYTLRPYQEAAVLEAIEKGSRYEAFDMGLGKTLIMLDFLSRTKKKALVIAPLLVAQRTWPSEIKKFTPHLNHLVLHGKDKEDYFKAANIDIQIMNFDGIKWLASMFKKHGRKYWEDRVLIIDEATAIKSASSARFKLLKSMMPLFNNGVYCLSGTPMPNGYKDLWSQYYMIDQGKALGKNISAYRSKYFYESGPPRWISELKPGAENQIKELIKPITSVLRAEDWIDMPEVLYENIEVDLPPKVRKLYDDFLKEQVLAYEDITLVSETPAIHSNKLRQLTQGCMYYMEGTERKHEFIHGVKLKALEQLVESANGDPILCPIAFNFEIEEISSMFGRAIPCISGKTPTKEKERLLNLWDKGELPLLLCQPAALSHGLNMQTGGHIICWLGRPWSLEQYSQLNGRLIRSGQTRPVRVYFIVANNTSDKKVAAVLESKAATQEDFKQAVIAEYLQ